MLIYFTPTAGISGDMFSGALIDAGADWTYIKDIISSLDLPTVSINITKILKDNIKSTKFSVVDKNSGIPVEEMYDQQHRNLSTIFKILENGIDDRKILNDTKGVFTLLAQAEAKVHNTDIENIHFHEVGSLDAIVDILSGVAAMHSLSPSKVMSAPINTGCGTIKCAHGFLSVPAPAVIELLSGCPTYNDGTIGELTTPTGAALLTYFCKNYGDAPAGNPKRTGFGAGTKTFTIPNLLRVTLY